MIVLNSSNHSITFGGLGIVTKRSSGEEKTTCPNCSYTRQKNTESCLSVNHDEGAIIANGQLTQA